MFADASSLCLKPDSIRNHGETTQRFGADRWTRIGAGNRPRATHTWNPASYPQGGWRTLRKRHVRASGNGSGMKSGALTGASQQVRGQLKGVIAANAERSGMTTGQALLHWVELGKGP